MIDWLIDWVTEPRWVWCFPLGLAISCIVRRNIIDAKNAAGSFRDIAFFKGRVPPGQFGLMQNTPVIYLWPHWHGSEKKFERTIFFPVHNPFTRSCANSVPDCSTVHTLCRSKTCTVPRVGVLTKGGSVQVFIHSKNFPELCERDLRLVWSGGLAEAGVELRQTSEQHNVFESTRRALLWYTEQLIW